MHLYWIKTIHTFRITLYLLYLTSLECTCTQPMHILVYVCTSRKMYITQKCDLGNVYRVKREWWLWVVQHSHSSSDHTPTHHHHLSGDTFAVFILLKKLTATSLIGYTLACSSVLFKFPTVDSFCSRRRASKMTHKTTADLILNQDVVPSEALLYIRNCNWMHKLLALLLHMVVDLCLSTCSSTHINTVIYIHLIITQTRICIDIRLQ